MILLWYASDITAVHVQYRFNTHEIGLWYSSDTIMNYDAHQYKVLIHIKYSYDTHQICAVMIRIKYSSDTHQIQLWYAANTVLIHIKYSYDTHIQIYQYTIMIFIRYTVNKFIYGFINCTRRKDKTDLPVTSVIYQGVSPFRVVCSFPPVETYKTLLPYSLSHWLSWTGQKATQW